MIKGGCICCVAINNAPVRSTGDAVSVIFSVLVLLFSQGAGVALLLLNRRPQRLPLCFAEILARVHKRCPWQLRSLSLTLSLSLSLYLSVSSAC